MKKIKKNKKTSIFKKIYILLNRLLGYEIIDQNYFYSPTINKSLSENLSSQGKKSIVLPLGEVKITRKVSSILVIFRSCSNVNIWSQNKKRIFESSRNEYTLRSFNSLIKSFKAAMSNLPNIKFEICVVDDNSDKNTVEKINSLIKSINVEYSFFNVDKSEFINLIDEKKDNETFSNLSSLLKCYTLAKHKTKDLVFFVEDDYLHQSSTLQEMIMTYERLASQFNREIFLCPSDYPYLYQKPEDTNVFLGNNRHWQSIKQSLCTFLTSKVMIDKYWDSFLNTCKKRNDPFEKHFHDLYKKELCLSPIPSLSVHCANINSSYGISPYTNLKKLWDDNKIDPQ